MSEPADEQGKDEPSGQSGPVRVCREDKGWVFEAGGKRAGPFTLQEMEELDFEKKVADELGAVKPVDILVARLKLPSAKLVVKSSGPTPHQSERVSYQFIVEAGQGPDVSGSGFLLFDNDDWIASEATYLYGVLKEIVEEANEITKSTESVEQVFFYNHKGERKALLARGAVFNLGPRFLRPNSKTLGSSGLQTLMSFETGQQFLHGENVSAQELYSSAVAGLKSFSNLDWDPRLYDVVVCLIIATYFYDLFGAFPIVILRGAFRGGKTRLLLCFTYMGHRGMAILDPSEASIFRTGEAWKPLLAIDEFYDVSKEVERILRAAYKKGPRVPRVEKTKAGVLYLGLFDFYSKVVIATPDPVPSNIEDKGITIQMRRMLDPHPEKRDAKPEDFEEFRSKAYIARLTWPPQIRTLASALDKEELGLAGRDYEVWKSALTIARVLGGNVWKNVLEYAKESTEEKHQSADEQLKEVLQAIYDVAKEKAGSLLLDPTPEKIFPVEFTPKQLHEIIWTRLKENYRVTKEKQEIQGEASERYDYDTHSFEKVYKVNRIGQTYLHQLGLKGKHGKNGTVYSLQSAQEFHSLVTRYHPSLPSLEEGYANLVPPSERLSRSSPSSPDPILNVEKEVLTVTTSNPVTTQVVTTGSIGDNLGRHPPKVVTDSSLQNEREKGLGDNRDNLDDLSGVSPHLEKPMDLVLAEATQLVEGKGRVHRNDLEACLDGKVSAREIEECMDRLVKDGVFDVEDWGKWRRPRL